MTRILPNMLCLMALLPVSALAQTPSPSAPAPSATDEAAPAGKAKSPLSHSNKQPIEITSDSLTVFQEDNRAVFVGHVIAIQGDLRLASDKMTVFYRKTGEAAQPGQPKAPKPAKAPGSTDPVQGDAIKHIDVEGNVVFTTPQDTAVGLTGNYDAITREIHLDDKVLLTHGNNTLKGEHLIYNVDTGKSVLVGGPEAPSQQPSALPSGRVRALFIPENKNPGAPTDKNAKKTDSNAKVTDGSSVKPDSSPATTTTDAKTTTDTQAP